MTIAELLNAKEGENVEFKEAKNSFEFDTLVKYACAVSNHGGGRVMFGITEKRPRKVVDSQAFEQPERTRKGLIGKLHVRVDFELLQQESKRVLVFVIAGRPIGLPIQADGIAWWRDGDSLVPMPEKVRRRIYEEGPQISAQVRYLPALQFSNVSFFGYHPFPLIARTTQSALRPSTLTELFCRA
jgi:ATP-dependent DNA helicase RecG